MSRVTLTNPFDLLTDENEDRTNVPAAKPKEQKPAPPKAAAPAKPAASKPAATGAAAAKPAAPKVEGAKAPAKPADAKAAPKSAGNVAVKALPPRDANQNLQERDKESRAPRTDKRDRAPVVGGDRQQKRPFDRRSGTGRPQNEVKKGGSGKGNWGGEVDAKEGTEALKEKEEKLDDKEEGEESKEEKPAEGEEKKEKEGEEAAQVPKVVVPEELTYDEYLAKMKQKAPPKGVETLKPRTVNADDFQSAGLVPLERGLQATPPLNAKEKKEKKEKVEKPASEKTEGKKEGKKEKNLAANFFTFASHQEDKRKERGPRQEYNNNPRGGYSGERRGPPRTDRGDRPPHSDNKGGKPQQAPAGAAQPPVQDLLKDFPPLGPHGSDPVKA